jgi:predicted secreted protein
MALVSGKDVILTINDVIAGDLPIGCARSVVFDIQRDMIDITGPGNGVYRRYMPSAIAFSGSIEGLVFLDTDNSIKMTMGGLYDIIMNGTLINLKYYETDKGGAHFLQKDCQVYIESINETASFDNIVTYTATFRGIGAPTITYGDV